jgi:hypothetical protein
MDHRPGESPGQWGPWGWEPVCVVPEKEASVDLFCLVSSPDFNSNKGLSIIGTKKTIGVILRDAVMNRTMADLARKHLDAKSDDEGLAYEVTPLPGRDVGVLAKRTIQRGEVIMVSLPAVVVDREFQEMVATGDDELADELYRRALDQLVDRERVAGLARSVGGGLLEDVLATNAHTGMVNGRMVTALYPEIAVRVCLFLGMVRLANDLQRLNHNCDPKYSWPSFTLLTRSWCDR